MDDVLSLYHEPYDPERPVVCFDEHPTQLVEEVRDPRPAEPGRVAREDYQYKPAGTNNLFLATEPLDGWRTITVTDRRTTEDWVRFVRALVDQDRYARVECIRVVLDNLNTHKPAAFYQYFEPAEARRILDTLEFHFTPVHGSWLSMAEIEFNAIQTHCLDRRISHTESLDRKVDARVEDRNTHQTGVDWQFTTDDARITLQRLYPKIED